MSGCGVLLDGSMSVIRFFAEKKAKGVLGCVCYVANNVTMI